MSTTSQAAAPAAMAAPRLTPAEIETGRQYLEQAQAGVLAATTGMSEDQWAFTPSPDCWSAAQIVEHLALTQQSILTRVLSQLAEAPVSDHPDAQAIDAMIVHYFPLRTNKFQAPESVRPTGGEAPSVSLEKMSQNQDKFEELLKSADYLRGRLTPSAPLQAISQGKYQSMDGYQWLLTLAEHNVRHTEQILELKSHADFPAR